MSTSLADILTAAKNLVSAVNGAAQIYQNVQGVASLSNITTSTAVTSKGGRLATVSVTTAGSASGTIYDGATNRPIYVIPMTVGAFFVNIPVSYGILVAPGTGQVVTVTYS